MVRCNVLIVALRLALFRYFLSHLFGGSTLCVYYVQHDNMTKANHANSKDT